MIDTEIAAFMRFRIMNAIDRSPNGLTEGEIARTLNVNLTSIAPRRDELTKAGVIKHRGHRPSRSGTALVWVSS